MRVLCALAAVLSLAASGVVVGAEPGPAPAAATSTATAPLGPKKLFGGGGGGGSLLNIGNKATKPLLPSAGKPTPASLALQRLQHVAANALR